MFYGDRKHIFMNQSFINIDIIKYYTSLYQTVYYYTLNPTLSFCKDLNDFILRSWHQGHLQISFSRVHFETLLVPSRMSTRHRPLQKVVHLLHRPGLHELWFGICVSRQDFLEIAWNHYYQLILTRQSRTSVVICGRKRISAACRLFLLRYQILYPRISGRKCLDGHSCGGWALRP